MPELCSRIPARARCRSMLPSSIQAWRKELEENWARWGAAGVIKAPEIHIKAPEIHITPTPEGRKLTAVEYADSLGLPLINPVWVGDMLVAHWVGPVEPFSFSIREVRVTDGEATSQDD